MCKDFDLTMCAFTQISEEGRKEGMRNQSVVKGGKSIPNKADLGYTVFTPTTKEMSILEPIIEKLSKGFGRKPIPNLCISIYKNRWFNYEEDNVQPKMIKIWIYFNGGTGECFDCFATDEKYRLINLPKTRIDCREEYTTD